MLIKNLSRDLPGGPVVGTLASKARVTSTTPGWETKIPHAAWPKNFKNLKKNLNLSGLFWWYSG